MNRIRVFVGLDYHQRAVQVCVLDAAGAILSNRGCLNDWRVIVERVEALGTVARVAIESCAGAADLAEELVQQAGWSVDLANARPDLHRRPPSAFVAPRMASKV